MTRRVQLLLNRAQGTDAQDFTAAVARAATAGGSDVARWWCERADDLPPIPGVDAHGFDAVVEFGVDGPEGDAVLFDLAGTVGEALVDVLDRSRSGALVGTEHIVVTGDGPVKLYYYLHRLGSWTTDAFHDYWLNDHAEYGTRNIAKPGYRQFHADPAASAQAAERLGASYADADGVTELYFEDRDAYLLAITDTGQGEAAYADALTFIDVARDAGMVTHLRSASRW